MEVLLGREADTCQLSVVVNGKVGRLDVGGSVPNTVSRYIKDEGSAHCRIMISTNGKMSIENLNSRNVTFVDGVAVDGPTRITNGSIVELGMDQYRVDIRKLIKAIGYKPTYSLAPLEKVWNRYDRDLLDLQLEQQKKQNQQRLQGLLSSCGMLLAIIPSVIPSIPIPDWVRLVVLVSALGLGVYFYRRGSQVSETFVMKKRDLDAKFRKRYVCPNPKCSHFLGFQPFDSIADRKQCPYCDCKLK